MAQKKENYRTSGDFNVCIPLASTAITSGDVVVMPRKHDPRSRAYLGVLNRVRPISSKCHAPYCVGVADADFTTDTVGATLYAAPTSNQAIPVIRKGVFALAITDTSGNAGDLVRYGSGATGAQLFTVDKGNCQKGYAVGAIEKSFSGATANDTQLVRLIEKDIAAPDIAWFLENRVVAGCRFTKHSVNAQASSQVGQTLVYGTVGRWNEYLIGGKHFLRSRQTDITVGPNTAVTASRLCMHWIVARSGGFKPRTCTLVAVSMADWTNSKVTAGYFIPKTITSGEIMVGLAVAFSATAITYRVSRIKMAGEGWGLNKIPKYYNWSV